MTDNVPSTVQSSHEQVALESLHARVKTIENAQNAPKTLLEKIQKHGGPIALVIGIFLSFVSIIDTFFSKPEAEFRKAQIDFNDRIGAIVKIRQDFVQLSLRDSGNAALIQATASILTPWIMSNLQSATLLLPRLSKHVGAPQLIVLAHEAIAVGDLASAEKFIDHAIKLDNLSPGVRADTLKYKARVLFLARRAKEGRVFFQQALDAIGKSPLFGIGGHRAMIYADWLVGEFFFGDCPLTQKLTTELLANIDNREVAEVQRKGVLFQLKLQILEWSKLSESGCRISPDLEARLANLK